MTTFKKAPDYTRICLECETPYKDGDHDCKNCGAVFHFREVLKTKAEKEEARLDELNEEAIENNNCEAV